MYDFVKMMKDCHNSILAKDYRELIQMCQALLNLLKEVEYGFKY